MLDVDTCSEERCENPLPCRALPGQGAAPLGGPVTGPTIETNPTVLHWHAVPRGDPPTECRAKWLKLPKELLQMNDKYLFTPINIRF